MNLTHIQNMTKLLFCRCPYSSYLKTISLLVQLILVASAASDAVDKGFFSGGNNGKVAMEISGMVVLKLDHVSVIIASTN